MSSRWTLWSHRPAYTRVGVLAHVCRHQVEVQGGSPHRLRRSLRGQSWAEKSLKNGRFLVEFQKLRKPQDAKGTYFPRHLPSALLEWGSGALRRLNHPSYSIPSCGRVSLCAPATHGAVIVHVVSSRSCRHDALSLGPKMISFVPCGRLQLPQVKKVEVRSLGCVIDPLANASAAQLRLGGARRLPDCDPACAHPRSPPVTAHSFTPARSCTIASSTPGMSKHSAGTHV